MQPAGYSTYWQYTTALAFSVLVTTNPVISSANKMMENLISVSSCLKFLKMNTELALDQLQSQSKVRSFEGPIIAFFDGIISIVTFSSLPAKAKGGLYE
jgi:hypothetical protein